jgi:hypothetical protein
MFQRLAGKSILASAFVLSLAIHSTASAQIGIGFGNGYFGPGGGGGLYSPYGFGPAGYPGLGFGNPGFGFANPGFGFGNGYSYAQPIYSTFNQPNFSIYSQPIYSSRVFTPQVYTLRTFSPMNSSALTYSGSTQAMTSSPIIIQSRGSSSSALPQPPISSSSASFDNGEILIFSPPTNSRSIDYTLNGAYYTMKPGTLQRFKNDRTWNIEVVLDQGNAKYTLSSGRYKFRQTETGMHLYSTKDNPEAPAPAPEPTTSSATESLPPVPMPE